MAFSQTQYAPTVDLRTLSAGLQSYYETLAEMANLVRQAARNYDLKQFCNSLFQSRGVKGHDFLGEVDALFFSAVTGFPTGVTRLMWNWFRMLSGQSAPWLVTATTRLRAFVRSWRFAASFRDLRPEALTLRSCSTFGVRSILIGLICGYLLTLQTNLKTLAGIKISRISSNMKYFKNSEATHA